MSEERTNPCGAALHPTGECPSYTLFFSGNPRDLSSPDPALQDCSLPAKIRWVEEASWLSPGSGGIPPGNILYEIMVDGSGDGHSIALFPGEEVFFSYERGASSNDAEFNAVILALENLPPRAHARIHTDSQVVVWHLSSAGPRRHPSYTRKKAQIEELIASRHLKIEIAWIPRKENRADRFLKHYIESLCGARGREPLHRRVRRLEVENVRLRARLAKAMKLLENRPVVFRDTGAAFMMPESR